MPEISAGHHNRTVMHFCGYILDPGCYLATVKVHRSAPFALMELTRQVIPDKAGDPISRCVWLAEQSPVRRAFSLVILHRLPASWGRVPGSVEHRHQAIFA